MAAKEQNKTEGSVSKEPKDKSFGERLYKKFRHLPKIGPPSPFSPLDVAYGLYKYKTGTFPIENAYSDLEFHTKPFKIDTGSVPVGTQFNSTDFDSSELGGAAKSTVKKYAKGGSVSASFRGDGIAQRGKTKGKFV